MHSCPKETNSKDSAQPWQFLKRIECVRVSVNHWGGSLDSGSFSIICRITDFLFRCFLLHDLWHAELLRGPLGPENSDLSLSHVWLFATPWTAACQASLSITNSWSLFKLMSIKSVMPSTHFILCHPLLFPPSIFLSIRVFSNESVLRIRWLKYWNFT